MTRRWTAFFAAVVLVASLACGAAPGAEDEPVSSNSTGDLDVEEEQVPLSFEELLEQAEQGDAEAQNNLAQRYEGVLQDDVEAVRWFRLAADQGHAGAQYSLGRSYATGTGVPQDYGEAARWTRMAADQGNVLAQNTLGFHYTYGQGVPRDGAEAVRWYQLAAEQDSGSAMLDLGLMYRDGRGVPQDDVTAHMWFNLSAARAGSEFVRDLAVESRDLVDNRLTPDQRAEAQRLAREWDEAHPR